MEQATASLADARARYRAWPVEPDDPVARAYRIRPVPHDFSALAPGLGRTYRRGRAELETAAAVPSTHHFHQWRKRVKYLRHQMELLQALWPEVMEAHARALEDLGDVLGDEHDLAEWSTWSTPPRVCAPTAPSVLSWLPWPASAAVSYKHGPCLGAGGRTPSHPRASWPGWAPTGRPSRGLPPR